MPKAERYLRAQRTDVATTFRAACCRYRCDGATRGARRTRESETVCVWKLWKVPATSLFYTQRCAQLAARCDHAPDDPYRCGNSAAKKSIGRLRA